MRDKLPDIELLRMFCMAGELRQFNLAAEKLGVSPPAVSQAVKTLERVFGKELFYL